MAFRAAAITLAIALGSCAHPPSAWRQADGQAPSTTKLQLDEAACRGEASKANLSAGREAALSPDLLGWSGGMIEVYKGCMAAHGYLPQ